MPIDQEAQRIRNLQHANNPEPGDYWQEMLCPILTVVSVDDAYVVVEKRVGGRQKMSRPEFGAYLRYDTMPDKTWADCMPFQMGANCQEARKQ